MATAIKWSDDGLCLTKLGEQPPAQMRPISPEEIATSHAASGRDTGVYGRRTAPREPSGFSFPMSAFVSKHEATVIPLVASGSAKAKR